MPRPPASSRSPTPIALNEHFQQQLGRIAPKPRRSKTSEPFPKKAALFWGRVLRFETYEVFATIGTFFAAIPAAHAASFCTKHKTQLFAH